MCSLCRIEVGGKALCAVCFERLGKTGELHEVVTRYRHYSGLALHLSVLGIFLLPLATLVGPLAMWMGVRGLRQSRKLSGTLGDAGARVAIGLGALESVGGALVAAAIFGAFK